MYNAEGKHQAGPIGFFKCKYIRKFFEVQCSFEYFYTYNSFDIYKFYMTLSEYQSSYILLNHFLCYIFCQRSYKFISINHKEYTKISILLCRFFKRQWKNLNVFYTHLLLLLISFVVLMKVQS